MSTPRADELCTLIAEAMRAGHLRDALYWLETYVEERQCHQAAWARAQTVLVLSQDPVEETP